MDETRVRELEKNRLLAERLMRFKTMVYWGITTAICDALISNAHHQWIQTAAYCFGVPSGLMFLRAGWLYFRAMR